VLVVEDDRELRELVRRHLQRAGHAVRTTGSGAEAIALATGGGVDLAALDLGLPDIDGREVLTAARADGREVPVVVSTARSGVDDRIEGLRRGADVWPRSCSWLCKAATPMVAEQAGDDASCFPDVGPPDDGGGVRRPGVQERLYGVAPRDGL
jgi:CheY-like chemotaxis protein